MKVILVNGSPKAEGCTYTALCEVAGALEKTALRRRFFRSGHRRLRGVLDAAPVRKPENVLLKMW